MIFYVVWFEPAVSHMDSTFLPKDIKKSNEIFTILQSLLQPTLLNKDVETPYSGMLPGHIAGMSLDRTW